MTKVSFTNAAVAKRKRQRTLSSPEPSAVALKKQLSETLKTVLVTICQPCLDGQGEECHTPGCAAPDLLAACKAARDRLAQVIEDGHLAKWFVEDITETILSIESSILKAEGKESQ